MYFLGGPGERNIGRHGWGFSTLHRPIPESPQHQEGFWRYSLLPSCSCSLTLQNPNPPLQNHILALPVSLRSCRAAGTAVAPLLLEDFSCVYLFVCSQELIPPDPQGCPCSDSPSPVMLDTSNPTCLPCQPCNPSSADEGF